jgi:hypothetical protein
LSRSFVSIVRRAGRAWRTEVRSRILGRSTIFVSPATSRGRSKASTSVRFSVAASIGLACSAALCWAVVGLVGPAGAGAHGNAHARVAVADGVPVREGQYRFATKLTMTNIPRPDGTHYDSACSAALIAPQWIVTAGHCFHDVNRNRVSGPPLYQTTATIGAADLSDPWANVVDVMYAIQSPSTDVAIARLAHPIRIVRPLRLSFTAPTAGEVVRLTGWGATSDVMPVPTTHLQTGLLKISTVNAATVMVDGFLPAADTSACLYDSGAPYFTQERRHRYRLVSVESSGPPCPHTGDETTSRIDNIAAWIVGQVRCDLRGPCLAHERDEHANAARRYPTQQQHQ